jgi:hypothetical protein
MKDYKESFGNYQLVITNEKLSKLREKSDFSI